MRVRQVMSERGEKDEQLKRRTEKEKSVKSLRQRLRGRRGEEDGGGHIYMRPTSSSGSCHDNHALASEHSRFKGGGRGRAVGECGPVSQSRPGSDEFPTCRAPVLTRLHNSLTKKHRITSFKNKAGFSGCRRMRQAQMWLCVCVCV